jgi:heme exporter protein C
MRALNVFALVGLAALTVYYVLAPAAANFREPALAKTAFWHIPCAFVSSALFFVAAWHGLRYLVTHELKSDVRLAASTELALVTTTLTLATGIFFSRVQWGEWWHWDPRQTSFLMVFLLYCGALALRAGISDESRRALASSAYAVASLLPAVFLSFVFPRLPAVQQASFHPTQTIAQNEFDAAYRTGWLLGLVAIALAVGALWRLRVENGLAALAKETEDADGSVDRGGTAGDRARRPVPVLAEGEAAGLSRDEPGR